MSTTASVVTIWLRQATSGSVMEYEGAFFKWVTEADAYFVSVPLALAESGALM